jgi:hypothetical protein
MRKLSLVLVAALATTALGVVVSAPAHAKPPRPKAELVTKQVSASLVAGKVTAVATVKNKGNKLAAASVAAFYLSADRAQGDDDTTLGTAPVRKIKPKKSKPVTGTFAIPASVIPGTYHVVVCADSGGAVRERKETNNCKASKDTVAVTGTGGPGPGSQVTISYAVSPVQVLLVGSVTGSATNGACTDNPVTGGGSCVVEAGVGTVTLTATKFLLLNFHDWSGASCVSLANPLVLTNPSADITCTANFQL